MIHRGMGQLVSMSACPERWLAEWRRGRWRMMPPLMLACTLGGCLPDRPADGVRDVAVEQPVPLDTVAEIAPAAAVPAAPASTAVAAPDELARLASTIAIPVGGILRTQLRDSYSEPRADRVHHALDILAPRGTPVLSAVDGRLLKLFDSKAGGLMVYATDASERFILLYGHLESYAPGLADGMPLTRGQVIGYVGTTGNAPPGTPHLHFGILRGDPSVSWSKGEPVNPFLILGGVPPGI